jgi:hypothetical protein
VRERHTSETMRNIPALSPRSRSFVIRCPAGMHNAKVRRNLSCSVDYTVQSAGLSCREIRSRYVPQAFWG